MAEEDAEIALLHQLQAGQESVAWGNEGANGIAEGELPSNTEHNNQEVQKDVAADDQVLRALSPSGADDVSDGGEYDPSSITTQPTVTVVGEAASRSSSRASTRKRRAVGGFLADDSDEEVESSTPTQTSSSLLQPPAANAAAARTPSPLHTSITQQDVQNTSENQSDSKTAPISSNISSVNSNTGGQTPVQAPATSLTSAGQTGTALPKARLPNDKIGILEDKIKEDPRGDIESWLALINEHLSRDKLEDARAVYERFFQIFPQAGEVWASWAEVELENEVRHGAERVFQQSLLSVPSLQLWSVYLNYIRRVNDLTNDPTGAARDLVSKSYTFVLDNVGMDRDSGKIWQDYIHFVRSGPIQIGGDDWQSKQKTDQVRSAYQRAICVPMNSVNNLWKEYDQFEMGLNKITGRKFLQEKSPGYMSARSANTVLETKTRGLVRTSLPKLPPAPGFDGAEEYEQQVKLWEIWIAHEKEDPLVLQTEDPTMYRQRVLYVYKQALMALRFYPAMWADAADWCFQNDLSTEGVAFLDDGIKANPESCLLAFKKADRLEAHPSTVEGVEGNDPATQGALVRAPFDKVLDALYDQIKQLKTREARDLAKLEESLALDESISAIVSKAEDDDEATEADKVAREADKANKTKVIQLGYASQAELISRLISFVWIALMRAMRRVQGKGGVKDVIGGSRQVFADARARGKLTSDVYVASALIEHHVYKDAAGTKIFERGAKLFPEDATFILEYLKHLLSIGDTTNARVAFETAVTRLVKKPELVEKSKPLYAYFHKYESQYGELSQIRKLEQRMAELFPNDPKLQLFATRYSTDGFEPTKIQPIISPNTQMRPRGSTVLPSIEQHTVQPSVANSPRPHFVQENSPRPQYVPTTNSPKRPFQMDDNDELNRPRKLARGESPLKGAAGRRLNQQKQLQQNQGVPQWHSNAPPFVVPRDITFLLSIIPRGDLYTSTKFNGDAMVRLLGKTHIPDFGAWKSTQSQPQPPVQQQVPQYGRPSAVSNDRPQSRDPTSYNFAPPQDDRRNASSWSSQAPSYGGGPSPVTHERDGFSRPPSYAQGLHPQGLPPRPDANNALTGYYQQDYNGPPGGAVNGAGWQQQPPQPQYSNQGPSLMPAQTWYPNPTDQYPPGQAGYPYNR